jgi:peptidyl-prolyl cis-trans isomerase B (cyclophilin B)
MLLNLFLLISTVLAAAPRVTEKVFFDMVQGNKKLGRIVIGVYGDVVPKTAKNFVTLATVYKCVRSVLIKGRSWLWIQGIQVPSCNQELYDPGVINFGINSSGDFTSGDGRGGMSIYDGKSFAGTLTIR